MYKSPIEIIQGQMRMEQENNILRAVMEQDIRVDKHELLRALQYDRGQYEKGYQDGQRDAVVHGRWIHVPSSDMMTGKAYKCSECNKMRYGSFMPNYCQNCGAKMDGDGNG